MIQTKDPGQWPDKPLSKGIKIARFVAFVGIAGWLIYAGWNALNKDFVPQRNPEMILDDTFRISWEHLLSGPDSGMIRVSSDNQIIAQKRQGQPWDIWDSTQWLKPPAKISDSMERVFGERRAEK